MTSDAKRPPSVDDGDLRVEEFTGYRGGEQPQEEST